MTDDVGNVIGWEYEIIVCDNCSTDETLNVATHYLGQDNYYYYRNTANIGMLNNLPETVARACGGGSFDVSAVDD